MLSERIVERLNQIVGAQRVLLDEADLQRFGVDRTTIWQANPCAVVLPGSIEEVQQMVLLANELNLAIVPSGGRTGLSGGAVAKDGEIVVAMDRFNEVINFNPVDRSVTVGAGMITANLQEFATEQGLFYPVDFAAAGSSQIGGNIATNAGGIKVIRYGMTRDWVMGLKVVNGAGDILELNKGLVKNNTGYDFRHLFIGSEGTLGLICEATIELARPPADSTVLVSVWIVFRQFSMCCALLARRWTSVPLSSLVNRHWIRSLPRWAMRFPLRPRHPSMRCWNLNLPLRLNWTKPWHCLSRLLSRAGFSMEC